MTPPRPGSRRAGALIPLFSIPSSRSWGIGEIGDLEAIVGWLDGAGIRILQLLPINEMADGQNSRVRIIVRETLEEITAFGAGGRQPGQFYGVHSLASDSKGNIYTTETYEGKRVQKFIYKGIGTVPRGYQGVLWPRKA